MSDIQAGDLIQKVGGGNEFAPLGAVRRCAGICPYPAIDHFDYEPGLLIEGDSTERGPPGGYCACHDPKNWRKLNDGDDDAELIARIKRCKPARQPEPAL